VRTLLLVGVDGFADQLRDFGFRLPHTGEYYGPSLALGSADVTLWELVGGYRALANGGRGRRCRLTVRCDRACRRNGAPIGDGAAFVVSDILADRDSRSITFGLENPLATRFGRP
jgi:penicillin-binding protein 1C